MKQALLDVSKETSTVPAGVDSEQSPGKRQVDESGTRKEYGN